MRNVIYLRQPLSPWTPLGDFHPQTPWLDPFGKFLDPLPLRFKILGTPIGLCEVFVSTAAPSVRRQCSRVIGSAGSFWRDSHYTSARDDDATTPTMKAVSQCCSTAEARGHGSDCWRTQIRKRSPF